ncbi:MAG: MiaB/RimO family radical SAM methylthiotransferase [Phycisphaerales bacterium]|nr:MiaB/RimO family radical SAM methylthiotransferase [Phycisphaerales bacterium]
MARTVYIETFGCQMNELDSQLVCGQLRALGYAFSDHPELADVVLYNTCSVREHAEQKVWSRLGELKFRKAREPHLVVGVLGCMAERDGEDLIRRMPVVDLLCGPGELDKLPALLDNAVRTRSSLLADEPTEAGPGDNSERFDEYAAVRSLRSARQVALQGNSSRRSATLAAAQDTLELLDLSRAVSPDDHAGSAYVRVTRGCNKFCTYCVVPFTRGAEVHRPPDHIVDECKRLADAGVLEITLLGQTVNHYRFEHGSAATVNGIVQPQKGRSYHGGHRRDPFRGELTTTFADLLARIHDEVPAVQRLRFVTSYPRDFGDDVLEVIRDHPRICRFLHVPAQSGSNRILQAMNRGYTVEEYLEFIDRARAYLHQPEIGRPLTIAGDIIVGFPSETDDDFEATKVLLRTARYKNCFIFKYSPRPGTPAYDKLDDDVPESVKRARNSDLLALQNEISEEVGGEYVGQRLDVFVQGLSQRERKKAARQPAASGACAVDSAPGIVGLTIGGGAIGASAQHSFSAITSAIAVESEPGDSAEGGGETVQLSARTEGDLIVLFDVPAVQSESLIGHIVPVRIESTRPLALMGELDQAHAPAAI